MRASTPVAYMSENSLTTDHNAELVAQQTAVALSPDKAELAVLTATERTGFWLAHRMNHGAFKRFWTFCQRHLGSLWIHLATYNLMHVYGLENVEKATVEKPLLLVSNHRSYFDMYAISAMLFRRTDRPMTLFFPVRAKFFYTSPLGWLVNLIMGWWAMYPPFFHRDKAREFDKFSLRKLIEICSTGRAHVIGFHPEGKRSQSSDPYEFLPAQTGVGKIVMAARPQVVPVFIAGLNNNLIQQVLGNWRGGEPIRIRFGEPLDLTDFYAKRDSLRTHKEIADFLMAKIGELGEQDRHAFAKPS